MKIFFLLIISIHWLIHLLWFIKAYNITQVNQLNIPISRTAGLFWLIACLLYVSVWILLLIKNALWRKVWIIAIILSQILIIYSWQDAKFWSLANLIIAIPIIITFIWSLPNSYYNRYKSETQTRLMHKVDQSILSIDDIKDLPLQIQKYLYYVNAIWKPKIQNFKVEFWWKMKTSINWNWLNINASQHSFVNENTRLFYIKSNLFGIPFDWLHKFVWTNATMQIKIANLLQIVDAKGEKMNQSETVTLFNDMCLLAPATLISKDIKWEIINENSVKATFTNKWITISATLYFNQEWELIDFESNDRYLSQDWKQYSQYKWSTPISDYQEMNWSKVIKSAQAIWHMPNTEYKYAEFNLNNIKYNTNSF